MADTKIEWAHKSWNPMTGCTGVSEGCRHCYACRMAGRLAGRFGYPKDDPFTPTFHADKLTEPRKWKKPRRVFLGSMTDVFHPAFSDGQRDLVFAQTEIYDQHTYLVLTKRPHLVGHWLDRSELGWGNTHWPENVWLGTTVESAAGDIQVRLLNLLKTPAPHVFVSAEPLLMNVTYVIHHWLPFFDKPRLRPLGWVIAGPETGPGHRPCDPQWIASLRHACLAAGIPFFDKSKTPGAVREFPEGMPL